MPMSENKARQLRGDMYYAFTPELTAARRRCAAACVRLNNAGDATRRQRVEIWRDLVGDKTPLPAQAATEAEDDELLANEPWVEPPFKADYGTNVHLGANVYVNNNATFIDTCKISIGPRTLLAPGVSIYSGRHPLDPEVRNGTNGPEDGAEIHIEEDCWIGGNVIILPGVRIGKGSTVGAGSVVTKDVAPYSLVVGNPARKIRDIPRGTKAEVTSGALAALERDNAAQSGEAAK